MKVTPANNRRMIAFSIVSIVLLFVIFYVRETGITLDIVTYYILHITNGFTFLATLWYLISILQFAGEEVSLQTPFSILLGLELVNYLISFTNMRGTLIEGMGILMGVIFVYAAINAFRVKNKDLKGAFRLIGIALLSTIFLKFSLAFLPIAPGRPLPSRFIGLIDEILLLAILYIIVRTGKMLKMNLPTTNQPSS